MFRALDKECDEEIIILDEKWHQGAIDELRLKGRSKILHCPELEFRGVQGTRYLIPTSEMHRISPVIFIVIPLQEN